MKKKSLLLVVLCMVVALSFMACSNDDEKKDDSKTVNAAAKTYEVKLYFVNEEYIETGDESKGMLAQPIDWKLSTTEGEQYRDVVDTCLRDAESMKKDDNDKLATVIGDNIQFNSVKVEDKTAYVDLNGQGLTGGSLDEILLVNQIVETLTNSFKEVDNVQFLVDGEVVDSLMGHVDTSKPIASNLNKDTDGENAKK